MGNSSYVDLNNIVKNDHILTSVVSNEAGIFVIGLIENKQNKQRNRIPKFTLRWCPTDWTGP